MSHNVTITRTVTSSHTTSTLIVNTGYLKTLPGLLKFAQLVSIFLRNSTFDVPRIPTNILVIPQFPFAQILGAVCFGMIMWYYHQNNYPATQTLFFLLMCISFLIGTFCLLVSCVFSLSTGGIISKTIYELIYHSVGFLLLFVSALMLLIETNKYSSYSVQGKYFVASVSGIDWNRCDRMESMNLKIIYFFITDSRSGQFAAVPDQCDSGASFVPRHLDPGRPTYSNVTRNHTQPYILCLGI